jgi:hypothetical protein
MEINGVDLSDLNTVLIAGVVPAMVPNRVLQLDGDMLGYECCGDDDQPFAYCKENWKTALKIRMEMAGAEYCNIHLTGANKGGRFDIALVKPYQANRDGKIKPAHLPALREWVQQEYDEVHNGKAVACYWDDQEADDGIAQGQYQFIAAGTRELSVVMSGDKDLGICSGLHCDWWTYEMVDINGYGGIYLDESGSSKKIKGKGTAFFWAQLLMGDTADNIPGLPTFGTLSSTLWPTAAYTESTRLLTERTTKTGKPCTALQVAKAKEVIESAKAKSCGPVAVYDYLKDCDNDLDALMLCIKAYQSHYGTTAFAFKCHRDEPHRLTSGHMLLEQAKLLWMRREVDECPSVFFKQVVQRINWEGKELGTETQQQNQRLAA